MQAVTQSITGKRPGPHFSPAQIACNLSRFHIAAADAGMSTASAWFLRARARRNLLRSAD